MVFLCRHQIINCTSCKEEERRERATNTKLNICPSASRSSWITKWASLEEQREFESIVEEAQLKQDREQVTYSLRNEDGELRRTELVALLDSLRKVTEAIEKLLDITNMKLEIVANEKRYQAEIEQPQAATEKAEEEGKVVRLGLAG